MYSNILIYTIAVTIATTIATTTPIFTIIIFYSYD